MNHRIFLIALITLLIGGSGAGFWYWMSLSEIEAEAEGAPIIRPVKPEVKLRSPFTSEVHWLVNGIVDDLVAMARPGTGQAAGAPRMTLLQQGQGWRVTLESDPGFLVDLPRIERMWDPSTYMPLARALLNGAAPANPAADDAELESMLERLLQPTVAVLETENRRLTAALQLAPLDGRAHARAAILLGVLAHRESSGMFWDVRSSLCRQTAHLALARALLDADGHHPAVNLAEAQLAYSACEQRRAQAALARLPAQGVIGTWAVLLQEGLTGDWRPGKDRTRLSLAEGLSHFSALNYRVSPTAALEWHESTDLPLVPDWARIVFSGQYSVSQGRSLWELALGLEGSDFAQVWKDRHGAPRPLDEMMSRLAVPTTRFDLWASSAQVIDWGLWSSYIRRHLCHTARQSYVLLARKWGVTEQAEEFRKAITTSLTGLPEADFLAFDWLAQADPATFDRIATRIIEHPEAVSLISWSHALDVPALKARLPRLASWYAHGFPPGSVYEPGVRLETLYQPMRIPERVLDALRSEAPYNYWLAEFAAKRVQQSPTGPQKLKEIFGPLLGYDLRAMLFVAYAHQDDPDAYRLAMEPACALDANNLVSVAWVMGKHGRTEAQAEILQQAVDRASDRVSVANNIKPLVMHYVAKGQTGRARQVADYAYGVFSAHGILAKVWLLEHEGDLEGAETCLRALDERYDDDLELIGFWGRHRDRREFADQLEQMEKLAFPSGLNTLSETDIVMTTAPAAGLRVVDAQGCGVDDGEVIIAVNDVRVANLRQFQVLARSRPAKEPTLVVWNGRAYRRQAVKPQTLEDIPLRQIP